MEGIKYDGKHETFRENCPLWAPFQIDPTDIQFAPMMDLRLEKKVSKSERHYIKAAQFSKELAKERLLPSYDMVEDVKEKNSIGKIEVCSKFGVVLYCYNNCLFIVTNDQLKEMIDGAHISNEKEELHYFKFQTFQEAGTHYYHSEGQIDYIKVGGFDEKWICIAINGKIFVAQTGTFLQTNLAQGSGNKLFVGQEIANIGENEYVRQISINHIQNKDEALIVTSEFNLHLLNLQASNVVGRKQNITSAIFNQAGSHIVACNNDHSNQIQVLSSSDLNTLASIHITLPNDVRFNSYRALSLSDYHMGNLLVHCAMYHDQKDFDDKVGFTVYIWIGEDLNEKSSFDSLLARQTFRMCQQYDQTHQNDELIPVQKTIFISDPRNPQNFFALSAITQCEEFFFFQFKDAKLDRYLLYESSARPSLTLPMIDDMQMDISECLGLCQGLTLLDFKIHGRPPTKNFRFRDTDTEYCSPPVILAYSADGRIAPVEVYYSPWTEVDVLKSPSPLGAEQPKSDVKSDAMSFGGLSLSGKEESKAGSSKPPIVPPQEKKEQQPSALSGSKQQQVPIFGQPPPMAQVAKKDEEKKSLFQNPPPQSIFQDGTQKQSLFGGPPVTNSSIFGNQNPQLGHQSQAQPPVQEVNQKLDQASAHAQMQNLQAQKSLEKASPKASNLQLLFINAAQKLTQKYNKDLVEPINGTLAQFNHDVLEEILKIKYQTSNLAVNEVKGDIKQLEEQNANQLLIVAHQRDQLKNLLERLTYKLAMPSSDKGIAKKMEADFDEVLKMMKLKREDSLYLSSGKTEAINFIERTSKFSTKLECEDKIFYTMKPYAGGVVKDRQSQNATGLKFNENKRPNRYQPVTSQVDPNKYRIQHAQNCQSYIEDLSETLESKLKLLQDTISTKLEQIDKNLESKSKNAGQNLNKVQKRKLDFRHAIDSEGSSGSDPEELSISNIDQFRKKKTMDFNKIARFQQKIMRQAKQSQIQIVDLTKKKKEDVQQMQAINQKMKEEEKKLQSFKNQELSKMKDAIVVKKEEEKKQIGLQPTMNQALPKTQAQQPKAPSKDIIPPSQGLKIGISNNQQPANKPPVAKQQPEEKKQEQKNPPPAKDDPSSLLNNKAIKGFLLQKEDPNDQLEKQSMWNSLDQALFNDQAPLANNEVSFDKIHLQPDGQREEMTFYQKERQEPEKDKKKSEPVIEDKKKSQEVIKAPVSQAQAAKPQPTELEKKVEPPKQPTLLQPNQQKPQQVLPSFGSGFQAQPATQQNKPALFQGQSNLFGGHTGPINLTTPEMNKSVFGQVDLSAQAQQIKEKTKASTTTPIFGQGFMKSSPNQPATFTALSQQTTPQNPMMSNPAPSFTGTGFGTQGSQPSGFGFSSGANPGFGGSGNPGFSSGVNAGFGGNPGFGGGAFGSAQNTGFSKPGFSNPAPPSNQNDDDFYEFGGNPAAQKPQPTGFGGGGAMFSSAPGGQMFGGGFGSGFGSSGGGGLSFTQYQGKK